MTGGPYSLGIAYPKSAFAHDAGDVEVGGLHGASRYMMCAYCKSWLWTEPEGMDVINVRTPMLAAPPNEPPIVEIATDEGFGWARIGARFSFSGFPDVTEFGPVLAAYSRVEAN